MRRLVLASLLGLASLAAHAADQSQVRNVGTFSEISNSGPFNISIDVGKAASVTASGSATFLDQLVTEVHDGELRIHLKDDHVNHLGDDNRITITLPQFTRYRMSGAGGTTLTHMAGDALDVSMSGAGSLKASGEVKRLKLSLSGVGSVDARELHAQSVRADVSGVGSVKVWSSDVLEGSVSGVGSLTYYGDPKTVNTRGGGIGSISRGK